MKRKAAGGLWILLCLTALFGAARAETRVGTIALEGMEEAVEETLYESPQGFSLWYAADVLEVYEGEAGGAAGTVVAARNTDDYIVLSVIPEAEAAECAQSAGAELPGTGARAQTELPQEAEGGAFRMLTLISENGRYLKAEGRVSMETAEGIGKYLQRALDSAALAPQADEAFLRSLYGEWAEEYEGAATALTLMENGEMSLLCRPADGAAYTCAGSWSYVSEEVDGGRMTLSFTRTDDPARAGLAYGAECEYAAYTESWVENDTLFTYLILNPPLRVSGVSPFEEVYGYDGVSLHREQGPNMRVVKCKESVSLRAERSTSAKRLAKVPLGAMVLAFPEEGEENGFIRCVYRDQEGFILSEYLQKAE